MANILDIEKIGELGKLDIKNLKLILRELLADILAEQQQTEDFKMDLSVILKLLFEKGLISKEEYEELKDKLNSLIQQDKVDDAFDDNLTDEDKQEIIKKSKFKGFFKTYNDLINKFPVSKAQHGDFAYIKDFDADTYDVNNIEEFIFDITYGKWMSATDTTHLRNMYVREDEEDTGRLDGQPLDNDIVQYNEALKRWVCRTWEEADIARKSHLDFHISNQLEVDEDIVGFNDGSLKDNGRLIVKLDTANPSTAPMHINKKTLQTILDEIDNDYYTKLLVDTEIDELGVERIIITGDDNDKYGNAIRRNVTNEVIRKILKNLYDTLASTFDIKKDPVSGRILNINEEEPAKYVPHGINTFNVDKIISAIDKDYNNAFKLSDKEETNYVDILKRVLNGYNELNIDDTNSQEIINRLTKLYENKNLWDRYTRILEYEKNKNITPEVFNDLIDLLHYLYISKDLIRDEILERDIVINGKKTFSDNIKFTGENFEITNHLCTMLINAGLVNYDNVHGVLQSNHQYINITNKNSFIDIQSKEVNIKNSDGEFNVSPNSNFEKDVIIKGNLTVEGTTTTVNSENLTVEDNIITLNKGELENGVSRRSSGIKIDRGSGSSYYFGYDENRNRLTAGFIENETSEEFDKINNIALIPKEELNIEKPVVYNPDNKLLINSEYIKTDIDGATTFRYTINEGHELNLLDCVCFIDGTLKKCSFDSYEACEVVGVVGNINGSTITVVVNGKIPQRILDIPDGTVLFLQPDGTLGIPYINFVIQRKVAIQTPEGIIVDIQKNSGWEHTEINREQICHRLVEANTRFVRMEESFGLNERTKVFFDGMLQVKDVHYKIDYECHAIEILNRYSYDLDVMVITNIDFAYSEDTYIDNSEIDDIFLHNCPEPRPPFEDTEYAKNYEIDRIFGIISNDPEEPPFNPDNVGWANNEEIDNIFSARLLYSQLQLDELNTQKEVYRDGDILYFVVKEHLFDKLDFIVIGENGKYKTLSKPAERVIGIIEDIQVFDDLIEYKLNTSKIISYNEIKLQEFSNKYKVNFNYGDSIYINNKINKFSGCKLGTFSEYGLFLEYYKQQDEIKTNNANDKIDSNIKLISGKYYKIHTEKLSINTLNIFEVDSPNYCQFNLINNTNISDKNLYVEILNGKRIFNIYRQIDEFVINPVRNIICKSELKFTEIVPENLMHIQI